MQKKFVESIKSTNTNQIQECLTYLEDLPLEVIELVLEKTAGIKGRWSYAKTVLDDWIKRGVDTVEKGKAQYERLKNKKIIMTEEDWEKLVDKAVN